MNANSVHKTGIIIVGAGFAGTGMAIKLRKSGREDFVVLERAETIGGTWRENHYPGAACDIKSYLYSYSFAPWPEWNYLYGHQEQILEYHQHCIRAYGLEPHIRCSENVQSAEWDETNGEWEVNTTAGNVYRAPVFITGTGPLNKVNFPAIPGRGSFAGPAFHTAQWNHEVDLTGKRVAVIGTGASAIQVVPAIAPEVRNLKVFQRSAPWIIHRGDHPISEKRKARYRKNPFWQKFHRERIYWQNEFTALGFVKFPGIMKIGQKLALRNLKKAIPDPELRRKATPGYRMGCKRVLRSDDYFSALARENVDLITEGIQEILPRGIRTADGQVHEVDVVIYATGFEASENMAPFEMKGREGISLKEIWKNGGESYLGTVIHGFPNAFTVIGPNTGLGHNSMIHIIESQVSFVLSALAQMKQNRWKSVEVKKQVQDAYNQKIQQRLHNTVWETGGCMSWYLNSNGKNTTLWPGFTFEFRRKTKKMKAEEFLTK